MKRYLLLAGVLAVCSLFLASYFAFAAGEKKTAVLELVNKAGITNDEASFLTDQVRVTASRMLPHGKFIVMTSENIKELLPPGTDLAKCSTASCEVEIGRMIGADYIVTGEILQYAGQLRVQIKVHHTQSGRFLGGEKTEAGDLRAQETMLSSASGTLMNLILTDAGVPAASPVGGAVFIPSSQPTAAGGAAEVRALTPTEQPPTAAEGPAGLYITTKPAGARVFLGTTEAGNTQPAFQKVNLQPGTRTRVTLKMDLYHDVAFDVDLKPGVTKFENVELKPAFGSLVIESEPSGAKVSIGGKEVGTTPYKNDRYPSGDFLVTVEKEWFLPATDQQLSVQDGQATKKMFTLSQDFGTLDVASNPAGAEVTLDGKKLGETPGTWRVQPVSKGKVQVARAAYRSKEFEIKIDRGQTVKITAEQATLVAKVGSLQVYADPPEANAKVFLDGKEVGTAPMTLSSIQEGTHEVKVETSDKEGKQAVTIAEGKTSVASVKLESRGGGGALSWVRSNPAGIEFTRAEITVAQYRECVNAGKCSKPRDNNENKYCNWGYTHRNDHPINCVDWNQATAFCSWAGGRLPTEDEWFAEASNKGTRTYPWGNQEVDCSLAIWGDGSNTDGCGKDSTWPVCSKTAGNSVSGLCDMSGNVWEWTSSSEGSSRVLRGGSWDTDSPDNLRAGNRSRFDPSLWNNYLGLRCGRSPTGSK